MRSPTRPAPGSTGPGPTTPDPVRRLGPAALAWRSVLLVAGSLLVTWGTLFGTDLEWPFGPMSQFAFRAGPDDGIHSTFLQARTTTGEVIMVALSPRQLGIARAEIEGQAPRIIADPALLKGLADAYHRLHPDRPELEQLWLRDRVTDLHRGRAVGEHVTLLVGWPVNAG